ncbi:MAG: glycosyltransferase family 39 protein [Verrucomicrobiia bacterium]
MQTASDRGAFTRLRPEFTRLLAILWVVGLALIYFVRYNGGAVLTQLEWMIRASMPVLHVGPYFREFWIARICDVGCVVAIMAASLGLGAMVAGRLIARRDVLGMLFALGVGLWCLAVLVLVTGAISMANVPCTFLALACWLLPSPRRFLGDFHVSTERTDDWAKLMIACLFLAAALNLAGALAPPFEYDELEYHLGALADYQRAGRIVFLPRNFYSDMPQLTEMLYLLAKATTSDIAAKLLHWLFGLLTAGAVYGVAQRLWSKRVGLTAAALFYCTPFVQDLSQTARIDLATAFFATLAFGALVLWAEEEEKRDLLWLSALGVGGAVATKWPAVPVVLFPTVLLLVLRRKYRLLPGFCLVTIVMVAPWLAKNWLLAGNPVYPLFSGWFPSPHWGPEQALVFSQRHAPTFGIATVGEFLAPLWKYSFVEAGAVPLLLLTAPLLLVAPWPEPAAKRAGWLVVGAYAGWFCFTFRPWRFLFPAFGMAAVAGAFAMEKLGRQATVRIAMRVSVGLVMASSLATLALNDLVDAGDPSRMPLQMSLAQYALGQFSRDEFVARAGKGVLEPIIWMNENLPVSAKVLYVGEARAYYAKQTVVYSTAFDQNSLTAMSRVAKTPEELLAALRAQGITHVYVNSSELNRLEHGYKYMADANWSLIQDMLNQQQFAKKVHTSGTRVVYELEH